MITRSICIMARKSKSYTGFVLGLIFIAAGAHAGMIDKEGMAPWEICGLCHSLNGISKMSKFPILAGQKSSYLRRQLMDFKQGLRSNDGGQMGAIVDEFEISDIDQIVNYFAGLPGPVSQQEQRMGAEQEEKFQKGKLLFENGRLGVTACKSCHNPVHPTAPLLEAQHADYIRKQLGDFRRGDRVNKRSAIMTVIAKRLSEDEVDQLAGYLQRSARRG